MHNLDTRYKAVVHYLHFERSLRKVAAIHKVSKSSLQRWVKASPKFRKQRSKKAVKQDIVKCVASALKANPFTTAKALVHTIQSTCKVRVSPSTASRYIKQAGFSRKKAFHVIDHEHTPEDVLRFCEGFQGSDLSDIVSIDEAGFYVGDSPKYGYSPRGCRLQTRQSRTLRRRKMTLILAVSRIGVVHFKVQDTNCKTSDFVDFIREMPQQSERTLLLMDNLQCHHSREVKQAIEARGWRALYTLPYSPRLNPIEYVFRSMKVCYRGHCPPENDDTFDYGALLVNAVLSQTDCEAAFAKVAQTVLNAVRTGGVNFSGYDKRSPRRRHVVNASRPPCSDYLDLRI